MHSHPFFPCFQAVNDRRGCWPRMKFPFGRQMKTDPARPPASLKTLTNPVKNDQLFNRFKDSGVIILSNFGLRIITAQCLGIQIHSLFYCKSKKRFFLNKSHAEKNLFHLTTNLI
jgi:hypothetical protein